MDNLKPCPFCGQPGGVAQQGAHRFSVDCTSCPATIGGIESRDTRPEAIAAWNTRPSSALSTPAGVRNSQSRAEIIRLARAAGITIYEGDQDRILFAGPIVAHLAQFAELVAAAEREACAVIASEMEGYAGDDVAAAIRARSQP